VSAVPVIVTAFCDWFRTHRGVTEPTLRHYARGAADLLRTLGEDVGQWKAQALRSFLLERASQCGTSTTQSLITSLRAFLRFLTSVEISETISPSRYQPWPTGDSRDCRVVCQRKR
jgi:site-specific recombinase XerD